MLQYLDNVNYQQQSEDSIDDQLQQLCQLCKEGYTDYELYLKIRQYIFKEIKIKQLAVTRILNDLSDLRCDSPNVADLLEFFIANNTMSYKEIGDTFGYSKQRVHWTVKRYSNEFVWLKNLMQIKALEDAKNKKGDKK